MAGTAKDLDRESLLAELRAGLRREEATRSILTAIQNSRHDEGPVFEVILAQAAQLCAASQASLQIANAAGTKFEIASYWGFQKTAFNVGGSAPLDSGRPIPEVIRTGQTINISDLRDTQFYREEDPVIRHVVDIEGVRSWLIVPLLNGSNAIGAIALSRKDVNPFVESELKLVESFAAQAVIAIDNSRQFRALEALNEELEDRVRAQVAEIERMSKLKRFLPNAVADTVISAGAETLLSSHRALLGVLFCDIRGFTAFCETAEPEETIEVLQTYHEELGKLINAHGAGVDLRMGDGVMVLFNDPFPCEHPAGDAVRLAIAMRDRMADLSKSWKRLGYRLGFGVGVSMGYATVGLVGYEGRFDYTASGTAVNLGARLCDEAEDGEILLSAKAAIAIEDDYHVESRGHVDLKGIRDPIEIFRLANLRGA